MSATTLDLSPAAILRRAATIIDRNGLMIADYYDEDQQICEGTSSRDCRVCSLGAIAIAAGLPPTAWASTIKQVDPISEVEPIDPDQFEAALAAAEAFAKHLRLGLPTDDVATPYRQQVRSNRLEVAVGREWNDRPQTQETVVDALRAAADDLLLVDAPNGGGATSTHRTLTQAELLAEAAKQFGKDPMKWAFQCPSCGDVATGQDFKDALAAHPRKHSNRKPVLASDVIGQECIGRTLGALKGRAGSWTGRGCTWVAYGLFRGPWEVTLTDGRSMWCFPLADAVVGVAPDA
ncbi:VVA0879 family protein [Streptosporangium sp. NPDC001559]|uniref:VVA0879 family protein n=1 Tax=Streptosporangium sp. NPDC001559 TaxID=3366187 RepID=UPI0036E5D37F